MAGHGGGGSDQTAITSTGGRKETKNLIDAISEIQVFSVGESSGAEISQNYFTWQMKIEFFSVGFRAFLAGLIICLLLVPLAVGVAYDAIPVYGGAANLYDKVFMFVLAFSISFGALMILLTASKYVYGGITYQMVRSLYTGAIVSAVMKGIILFVVFQVIAALITPSWIVKMLGYVNVPVTLPLDGSGLTTAADAIFWQARPIFRISSVITFLFALLAVLALLVSWWRMRKHYLKLKHIKEYIDRGDA